MNEISSYYNKYCQFMATRKLKISKYGCDTIRLLKLICEWSRPMRVKLISVVLIILIILILNGCQDVLGGRNNKEYKEGLLLYDLGKYEDALEQFDKAIEKILRILNILIRKPSFFCYWRSMTTL